MKEVIGTAINDSTPTGDGEHLVEVAVRRRHTPEPWVVTRGVYVFPEIWSENADECVSDRVFNGNAERIVACVNACAGMELEDIARIPAMLEDYSRLVRKVAHGCTDASCSLCDNAE